MWKSLHLDCEQSLTMIQQPQAGKEHSTGMSAEALCGQITGGKFGTSAKVDMSSLTIYRLSQGYGGLGHKEGSAELSTSSSSPLVAQNSLYTTNVSTAPLLGHNQVSGYLNSVEDVWSHASPS